MTDAIIGTTYTLLTYYITYSGSLYANIISQVPGTAGLCNGAYNSVSNPTVFAFTIVLSLILAPANIRVIACVRLRSIGHRTKR